MSTALQVIAAAYRSLNETEPTSFLTTQSFPLNIAIDVLNQVISEMNRMGNLYFTETKTALTYGVGTYQYAMSTLGIDPRRIRYIRRELTNYQGNLEQKDWSDFQDYYRRSALQTTTPNAWSKYGDTLELNTIPDQDYSLQVYHFKDMPQATATGDTFLLPVGDEDILKFNCKMWLGAALGRWAEDYAITLMKAKTEPLLVAMKTDAGIPRQMPKAF